MEFFLFALVAVALFFLLTDGEVTISIGGAEKTHACEKCGHDASVTVCPDCGRERGSNNYCIQCGHIYYKAGGY